ncbi:MAG: DUF4292 domain-containing protein [Phocaeicola sp.]
MIKRTIPYILTLCVVLLVAACSTTKLAKKERLIGDLSEEAYLSEVIERGSELQQLTAKMALTVNLTGKATRVSGTLRMRKNESIQLSVAPLLGIEVGRIEITPQKVVALDRINKRYVELSFGELTALLHTELDFYTLQALFFNELFLPGKREVTPRDASRFELSLKREGEALLEVKQSRHFTYQFYTTIQKGTLVESNIAMVNKPYLLKWKYDQFVPVSEATYPSYMRVAFEGAKKPIVAELELSRLSTEGSWQAVSEIPKRYEKVEIQTLLKALLK